MSSSSDHETTKKAVKGRPTKKQSCNEHCRVCRCNLKSFYGDFNRIVLTENSFAISKRAGVWKFCLADLVTELGFSCEKNPLNQAECAPNVPLKFRTLQNLKICDRPARLREVAIV